MRLSHLIESIVAAPQRHWTLGETSKFGVLEGHVLRIGDEIGLMAHGVKDISRSGKRGPGQYQNNLRGRKNLLNIILEQRIRPGKGFVNWPIDVAGRQVDSLGPYYGKLSEGGDMYYYTSNFGPYYIVLDPSLQFQYEEIESVMNEGIGSKYHQLFIVPDKYEKKALKLGIEEAVEKGIIGTDYGKQVVERILTYEEFIEMATTQREKLQALSLSQGNESLEAHYYSFEWLHAKGLMPWPLDKNVSKEERERANREKEERRREWMGPEFYELEKSLLLYFRLEQML